MPCPVSPSAVCSSLGFSFEVLQAVIGGAELPTMFFRDLLPLTGSFARGAADGREGKAELDNEDAGLDEDSFTFAEKVRTVGATDEDDHGVDFCG